MALTLRGPVNWCTGNPKCFTCKIKAQYRRTRRELFPLLSRIQNIAYDLGENGRTPEWYRANHRTPWVATKVKTGDFCAHTRRGLTPSRRRLPPRSAMDGRAFEYHRAGYDHRPMVFRGDGTFAVGGAGCERYWTIRDGRLLIAGEDGRLTMDLRLWRMAGGKGRGWCTRRWGYGW